LLVNRLSTIAFGAQPPPGSTPLAGPAAALAAAAAPRAALALADVLAPAVLAPAVLAPGEGLAVRKGRLADDPAEADALAPGDVSAPGVGVPL
jgi:hypothetical protein